MFKRGAACFMAEGFPCASVEDEIERRDNILDGFIDGLNIYSKVARGEIAGTGMGDPLTYDECRGLS